MYIDINTGIFNNVISIVKFSQKFTQGKIFY